MTQQMTGILVLIASPGDTAEERATVREKINDWNISNGRRQGVVLLPWLYERNAVPALGGRAQAVINSQAVDQADVVVAFFDARLGSSTGVDVSGTAEEIHRAHEKGKPVHIYFSNAALPRDFDRDQEAKLNDFKLELRDEGLLGDYEDPEDLAGQVIQALEYDIDVSNWSDTGSARRPRPVGANLKWRHDHEEKQKGLDSKNKMQYQVTKNRLVVENKGDVAAENLVFTVSGTERVRLKFAEHVEAITLQPDSVYSWTAIPLAHGTLKIEATWTENGEAKHQERTIDV
ncbi:hypothetical protein ACXZ66_01725 [Corynebacterium sp. S7]